MYAIKIHSLIHNQLSAPAFFPMFKYAWFAAKIIEERSIFLNINAVCFPVNLLKKHCVCREVSFIKCAWCEISLCFTCFYDKYHSTSCSRTVSVNDDDE